MENEYLEVKTPIDGLALFYGEYRGKSAGRIIHYIWGICGSNIGEACTIGWDKVKNCGLVELWGKPMAYVDHSGGYPHFTFLGEHEHFNQKQKDLLDSIT